MADDHPVLLTLTAFAVSLGGFWLLALASERQGQAILQRQPTQQERRRWRLLGGSLLALALVLCVQGWGTSIGMVAWPGVLCIVGTVLVFALARRVEKPATRSNKKPLASPVQAPRSQPWRKLALLLLALGPIGYAWALHGVTVKPVMRADAIHGQVGPWPFALAEMNHNPPKLVANDTPTKAFQLRFCQACDADIRAAHLKVNRPRSLRGAGLAFYGARWDRSVDIPLPAHTHADSELWLTVEGKDGTVHYATVRLKDIAPTTAQWFTHKGNK